MRRLLLRGLVFVFLTALAVGVWFGVYVNTPSPGQGETTVTIAKGSSVRQIKRLLGSRGLIHDDVRFLVLARLSGSSGRLRAGEFIIPLGLTPLEVLRLLEKGEIVYHRLTIPEGKTVSQIAELYARDGWVDRQRFLTLTRNKDFIHELGLKQDSLEGYLFPDTYLLVLGEVDERSVITMMVQHFFSVWDEVSKTGTTLLNRHEVVTLASIVEKETAAPQERPLIAQVFLHRLERGMRLQTDPTVIYGLENFNGNLTRADLKRETPYNTYVIAGLPPGPICNPGRAAMEAIFQPADSDALYFVSRNDGTHHFSRTFKEHNRAVYKFQKSKR